MSTRIEVEAPFDPKILGEKLKFSTSGRVAKNRFLKAALSEKLCLYEQENPKISGIPTQTLINLYSKWAHGGFGMILTGNIAVDFLHPEEPGNVIIEKSLDSLERRDAFKKLTDTMKSGGTLAVAQITNAGRMTQLRVNPTPFSPSVVPFRGIKPSREFLGDTGYGNPIELTQEQIQKDIIEKFVYAAKFCQEVGFDGVELHGAHGYLLSQFMSPSTNKRTDQYGGSLENRVRLILEIYDAIRSEIPAETGFIVGIKMNSVEFQDHGLENDDAVLMCQEFEKHGFDFIELSGGTFEKLGFQHAKESTKKREAYFIDFCSKIKPALKNTTVYLTGGFRTVPGMVSAIEDGITDGIGLGRPITSEPDLSNKILHQKVQSALVCLVTNQWDIEPLANCTQMWQAGQTTIEQVNGDICYGIMDTSDQKVIDEYKKEVERYTEGLKQKAKTMKPFVDVLEYEIESGA